MKYYRGTHDIKQIVILSTSGNLSLDALSWCSEQGITVIMIGAGGKLLYSMVPEAKVDGSLRRLQYKVSDSPSCSRVAISLVQQKTASQLLTVKKHPELVNRDEVSQSLTRALAEIATLPKMFRDIAYLMTFEGRLAAAYFNAFVGLPINWQAKDAKVVPPHWKAITQRSSPLSSQGTARHAVCPFQAALNYLYAVTEHQLLQAIHITGLDPACGFLHADHINRQSLIYDLVEPLRAVVDDKVLSLFGKLVLKRGDCVPLRNGGVLFNADFVRYLVAACRLEQDSVDAVVNSFKQDLLQLTR